MLCSSIILTRAWLARLKSKVYVIVPLFEGHPSTNEVWSGYSLWEGSGLCAIAERNTSHDPNANGRWFERLGTGEADEGDQGDRQCCCEPKAHQMHRVWPWCIKHMGVSGNRGTPKWMVYNGRSHLNGWFKGPLFQETSIWCSSIMLRVSSGWGTQNTWCSPWSARLLF